MSVKPLLVLGNKNYSSWSLRPWLFMRHFGVEFDEQVLPLFTERFHAEIGSLSPTLRLPVLRHGELTVWDSLAICEYVNERFLAGRGWPADSGQRAVARAATAEMHSGFSSLRSECPMNLRKHLACAVALSDDARRDVARVCSLWIQLRGRYRSGGDFLFGEFSLADAFFAPVATRIRSYAIAVGAVERAYVDAIFALPAMREWVAAAECESERIEKVDAIGADPSHGGSVA